MVMPSEEGIGERNQGREHSVGNVTQPFVTETYHCVASYETKDTKNKPFKVAVDEKVDVLIKDKAGERETVHTKMFRNLRYYILTLKHQTIHM
jgi:NADPH oxidase organizer 1